MCIIAFGAGLRNLTLSLSHIRRAGCCANGRYFRMLLSIRCSKWCHIEYKEDSDLCKFPEWQALFHTNCSLLLRFIIRKETFLEGAQLSHHNRFAGQICFMISLWQSFLCETFYTLMRMQMIDALTRRKVFPSLVWFMLAEVNRK